MVLQFCKTACHMHVQVFRGYDKALPEQAKASAAQQAAPSKSAVPDQAHAPQQQQQLQQSFGPKAQLQALPKPILGPPPVQRGPPLVQSSSAMPAPQHGMLRPPGGPPTLHGSSAEPPPQHGMPRPQEEPPTLHASSAGPPPQHGMPRPPPQGPQPPQGHIPPHLIEQHLAQFGQTGQMRPRPPTLDHEQHMHRLQAMHEHRLHAMHEGQQQRPILAHSASGQEEHFGYGQGGHFGHNPVHAKKRQRAEHAEHNEPQTALLEHPPVRPPHMPWLPSDPPLPYSPHAPLGPRNPLQLHPHMRLPPGNPPQHQRSLPPPLPPRLQQDGMHMDCQPDSMHTAETSRPAPPWLEQPPLPPHVAEAMAGHVNHGIHGKNGAAPEHPDSNPQKRGPRRQRRARRRQQHQQRAERVTGDGMTDAEPRQPGADDAAAGQGARSPGTRQLPGGALHEQRDGAVWPLADGAMSHGAQPSVPGLMDEASWVSLEGGPPIFCLCQAQNAFEPSFVLVGRLKAQPMMVTSSFQDSMWGSIIHMPEF